MASEFSVRTAATPTPRMSPAASERNGVIPSRGARIEFLRFGASVRGTVSSADERQILVSLDDGRTAVLNPGRDRYQIIPFH
jgi:hypothetical protein